MRPIYVCGEPRGGTSAVAESLVEAGIDMGHWKRKTTGPYQTYECQLGNRWNRHPGAPMKSTDPSEFERYYDLREQEADNRPWGVKCFAHKVLLNRPHLRERFHILRVYRPLEDTIRSALKSAQAGREMNVAQNKASWWVLSEHLAQAATNVSHVHYPIQNYDWIEELQNA